MVVVAVVAVAAPAAGAAVVVVVVVVVAVCSPFAYGVCWVLRVTKVADKCGQQL